MIQVGASNFGPLYSKSYTLSQEMTLIWIVLLSTKRKRPHLSRNARESDANIPTSKISGIRLHPLRNKVSAGVIFNLLPHRSIKDFRVEFSVLIVIDAFLTSEIKCFYTET